MTASKHIQSLACYKQMHLGEMRNHGGAADDMCSGPLERYGEFKDVESIDELMRIAAERSKG